MHTIAGSIACLLLGVSCVLISGGITFVMICEVNRRLPDDRQFSYLWFHPTKVARLHAEFRRLYPRGKLVAVKNIVFWMGFILGVVWIMLWS